MRGKRGIHCIIPNSNGITPAGAGKTKNLALVKLDSWDHPRRCGENLLLPLRGPSSVGSPPQVRGKRHLIILNFLYFGITPAGAGKTIVRFAYMGRGQDHPRRCGENFAGNMFKITLRGITPAGAGKTMATSQADLYSEDHPRRCGENIVCFAVNGDFMGSPPQVRGKQLYAKYISCKPRITPAGAGKTQLPRLQELMLKDHPRRCGEN